MPETEAAAESVNRAMGALFLLGGVVATGLLLWSLTHPPPWHRRILAIARRPWQALDVGIVLCVIAAGQVLAVAIHRPDVDEHSWQYFGQFVLETAMVFHGAAALATWILFRARDLDPRRAFGLRRGRGGREAFAGVLAYLGAFPVVTVVAVLAGMFLNAMQEKQSFQEVVRIVAGPDQTPALRVYLCLLAVIVAPVVEEMVFRGMALPVLTRYLGFPVAVAIVSAVFALMHGHIWSLAPLFAIAVAFSLAYTLTGSLRVPIVMHAIFNAVNLAQVLLFPDVVNTVAR